MSNIGTSPTREPSRSAEVDEFIAEHYGLMSYREMGDALGCSRTTVYRRVKALGLTKGRADTQIKAALDRIEAEPSAPENDQMRRLYELRDMQRKMLVEGVSMQSFASISREYRETLRQIADLQQGEAPDRDEPDVAGPLANLMAAMPDLSSLASMTPDA